MSVIKHAISYLNETDYDFSILCCLYATAPFASKDDIVESFRVVNKNQNDIVFPVSEYDFPIQRAIKINENKKGEVYSWQGMNSRSQDLETFYHDAGQFYTGYKRTWEKNRSMHESFSPIVIPRWRVQDIDTIEDWERAETIQKIIEKRK